MGEPLDLGPVNHRRYHALRKAAFDPLSSMEDMARIVADDVPALLAEVERLREQPADEGFEYVPMEELTRHQNVYNRVLMNRLERP